MKNFQTWVSDQAGAYEDGSLVSKALDKKERTSTEIRCRYWTIRDQFLAGDFDGYNLMGRLSDAILEYDTWIDADSDAEYLEFIKKLDKLFLGE